MMTKGLYACVSDWKGAAMVYPFLALDDDTELVHSEMKPDGTVRVDIERPDAELCFKSASCWLPSYVWENVEGFSQAEIDELQQVIESCAHLIIEFSQTGGFDNASGF